MEWDINSIHPLFVMIFVGVAHIFTISKRGLRAALNFCIINPYVGTYYWKDLLTRTLKTAVWKGFKDIPTKHFCLSKLISRLNLTYWTGLTHIPVNWTIVLRLPRRLKQVSPWNGRTIKMLSYPIHLSLGM